MRVILGGEVSLRLISMIPHIRLPNTGGFGAQKAHWEGKLILTLLYACLRSSRYLQGGGTSVDKLLALTTKLC